MSIKAIFALKEGYSLTFRPDPATSGIDMTLVYDGPPRLAYRHPISLYEFGILGGVQDEVLERIIQWMVYRIESHPEYGIGMKIEEAERRLIQHKEKKNGGSKKDKT